MSLTGLAFLVCFSALLLLAFVRHPVYGLYAYLVSYYVHPPSRWWGAGLPDLRWALLAAVVTFIALMSKKQSRDEPSVFKQTPAILLILFTVWVWIQTPWALRFDLHVDFAILYTKYILLIYLLYRLLQTEADLRNFLLANLAGCGYLGYKALIARGGGRLEGVGGPDISEANALGMQFGVGIMFASMLLLILRNKIWFLVLLPIPLMANGLVQTQSRSAFLATVVAGVALWYLKPPRHNTVFYTLAGLAVFGFLSVAGAQYWERMNTVTAVTKDESEMDKSAESRFVIAEAQWKMFKLYPHGAGHRGPAALSPIFIPEEYLTGSGENAARSSHNTFLSVLVEQGVPGALLFFAAVIWTVNALRRLRKLDAVGFPPTLGAYRAAAGAGLVVVLVGGLFVDYLKVEIQIWCLAILLSLLRIAERDYGLASTGRARRRRPLAGAGVPPAEGSAVMPVTSVPTRERGGHPTANSLQSLGADRKQGPIVR